MRTSRKRTIAIIVPVTVLALAGIATAAGLTTTSATLGGGSTLVTNNCAIKVTYDMSVGSTDVAFQAPVAAVTGPPAVAGTLGGYYLTKVTVTPLGQADCANASFRVTVAKASGAPLGEGVGVFTTTTAAVKVNVSAFAQDVGAAYATVTTGSAAAPGIAAP